MKKDVSYYVFILGLIGLGIVLIGLAVDGPAKWWLLGIGGACMIGWKQPVLRHGKKNDDMKDDDK